HPAGSVELPGRELLDHHARLSPPRGCAGVVARRRGQSPALVEGGGTRRGGQPGEPRQAAFRRPRLSRLLPLTVMPEFGRLYFLVPKSTFGVCISVGGMSKVAIGWEEEYRIDRQMRPGKVVSSVL